MSFTIPRRAASFLAAAALVTSAGATGAIAEDGPQFRAEQVYMQCDGSTKASNVNLVVDGAQPGWSTEAPAGSVQGGEGCGAADPSLSGTTQETIYDATWRGFYIGNLDNMQVELHMIAPQNAAFDAAFNVTLTIDGNPVTIDNEGLVEVTATESETGASYAVEFAVDGLNLIDDFEGEGTRVHDIHLTVSGNYIDTGQYTWVWGTTEVPAGIEFNKTGKLRNTIN